MEQARYKMKNASKLSENEIKNQIIDILGPSLENSLKEDLLFHLVKNIFCNNCRYRYFVGW